MNYIAPPSSEFCPWLGLICPQSRLISELNDQSPLDLSDSLVEPGTSSSLVLVTGGHQGPRDPGRCHWRRDTREMCAAQGKQGRGGLCASGAQ